MPNAYAHHASSLRNGVLQPLYRSARDQNATINESYPSSFESLEGMGFPEWLQQVRSAFSTFRTLADVMQSNSDVSPDREFSSSTSDLSLDNDMMAAIESNGHQLENARHRCIIPAMMNYFDRPDEYSKEQNLMADGGSECGSRSQPQWKYSRMDRELSTSYRWSSRSNSFKKRFSFSSSQASDIMTVIGCLSLSSKDTESTTCHPPEHEGKQHRDSIETRAEDRAIFPCDVIGCAEYSSHCPASQRNLAHHNARELSEAALKLQGASHLARPILDYRLLEMNGRSRDQYGNTALHIAAACGAGYACLRNLVSKSPLNALNNANQTFMHVLEPSTLVGDQDFVPFLSALMATTYDFSQRDDRGSGPLQSLLKAKCWASPAARTQLFDALAMNVLDLDSRDAFGIESRSILAALIKTDPELLSCANVDQETLAGLAHAEPLPNTDRFAAKKRYARTITINAILAQWNAQRLSRAADDATNDTATLLTENEFETHLEFTLACSMDLANCEDKYGRSAFHLLAYTMPEHYVSATRRFANDSHNRRMRRELYERRAEQATRVIEQGVSLNSYDKQGQTPLLAMITKLSIHDDDVARSKLVKLLLKAGANVNCRGRQDETPLHEAVERGFISTTGTLLKYGARPNACKAGGQSVVFFAIASAHRLKASLKREEPSHQTRNLHLRILTCIEKVMAHGGVEFPTLEEQWSVDQTGSV